MAGGDLDTIIKHVVEGTDTNFKHHHATKAPTESSPTWQRELPSSSLSITIPYRSHSVLLVLIISLPTILCSSIITSPTPISFLPTIRLLPIRQSHWFLSYAIAFHVRFNNFATNQQTFATLIHHWPSNRFVAFVLFSHDVNPITFFHPSIWCCYAYHRWGRIWWSIYHLQIKKSSTA